MEMAFSAKFVKALFRMGFFNVQIQRVGGGGDRMGASGVFLSMLHQRHILLETNVGKHDQTIFLLCSEYLQHTVKPV